MEEGQKKDGNLVHLQRTLRGMAEAQSADNPHFQKFQQFFSKLANITDTYVDLFLEEFLFEILTLPSSEASRQNIILAAVESLMFDNETAFVKKVIERLACFANHKETAQKTLAHIGQKFHKMRTSSKFVEYLMRAVEANQVALFMDPQLRNTLADGFLKMPLSQSLAMGSSMCNIISSELEQLNTDVKGTFGKTHLAADILSLMLLNVRLADFSIRDETTEEVVKLLALIKERLGLLSNAALQEPKEFAGPFLSLAFAIGELTQLLVLYSPSFVEHANIKPELPEPSTDEPWNLCFIHPCLNAEQWQQLFETTSQLEAQTVINLWAPLAIQKIRHLILFSGQSRNKHEKILRKLVGYLIENIDTCRSLWLNNVKYLWTFMAPRQQEMLAQKMVASPEDWQHIVTDPEMQDRRSFLMAITCAVFRAIHDRSRKRKADEECSMLSPVTQSILKMLSLQADVWIGGLDRSAKEVVNWLRQSADKIKESMDADIPPNEHDLTDLFSPLSIIEKMPLEFTVGPVHSAALMGVISILFSGPPEAIQSRIWVMVIRLLDNSEKLSSLYDYFPSTKFLTWAESKTRTLPEASLVFTSLFDEILRSPQGLRDATQWIESAHLPSFSLSVIVLAMKKLSQQKETPAALKIFDVLRKHFLDTFEVQLESGAIDVLEGSVCLMKHYNNSGDKKDGGKTKDQNEKQSEDKFKEIEVLIGKLTKLIEVARKGVQSTDEAYGAASSEFLTFIFAQQRSSVAQIAASARIGVWNTYRQCQSATRWEDRLLRALIAKASKKELLIMVNAIMEDFQNVSNKSLADDVQDDASVTVEMQRVCSFFRHLVVTDLPGNDDRYGVRLQAVQTVLPLLQHLVLSICRNASDDKSLVERAANLSLPPMSVYLALLNLGPSYAYPHDVASALHACLALPMDAEMTPVHFDQVFTVVYKVVHYLLVKHEEVAADRVPVVLQAYRRMLSVTCARADQKRKADPAEVAALTDCANRLSRLASVINSQRLRYRRVGAYLAADVMDEFKRRALYPSVKHELTTALHHLMDILDDHAVRFLMTSMPPGVRELFRVEYDQFGRFYKFKGKV